jgi:hypothetical protein
VAPVAAVALVQAPVRGQAAAAGQALVPGVAE